MSQKFFRDVREEVMIDGESMTETGYSDVITAQNVEIGQFYLVVADWSGLTTLDVTIQCKDPAGNWHDTAIVFTQASGNTTELIDSFDPTNFYPIPLGKYVRGKVEIAGTGSATVTLSFIGKS